MPWDASVKEPLAEPPAANSPWGGTGRRVVPLSSVMARVHNGLISERQVAKVDRVLMSLKNSSLLIVRASLLAIPAAPAITL